MEIATKNNGSDLIIMIEDKVLYQITLKKEDCIQFSASENWLGLRINLANEALFLSLTKNPSINAWIAKNSKMEA